MKVMEEADQIKWSERTHVSLYFFISHMTCSALFLVRGRFCPLLSGQIGVHDHLPVKFEDGVISSWLNLTFRRQTLSPPSS
jgi:hypothetical protein